MEEKTSISIFQRPMWVACLAATAAFAWGLAYPFIKMGYAHFAITPEMTGSKILFAGVRFTICGLIILAVAASVGKPMAMRRRGDWCSCWCMHC